MRTGITTLALTILIVCVVARDRKRSDDVRAYAYAALGFLGDSEERGSILKLLIGANYPLRTWASTELHSIL